MERTLSCRDTPASDNINMTDCIEADFSIEGRKPSEATHNSCGAISVLSELEQNTTTGENVCPPDALNTEAATSPNIPSSTSTKHNATMAIEYDKKKNDMNDMDWVGGLDASLFRVYAMHACSWSHMTSHEHQVFSSRDIAMEEPDSSIEETDFQIKNEPKVSCEEIDQIKEPEMSSEETIFTIKEEPEMSSDETIFTIKEEPEMSSEDSECKIKEELDTSNEQKYSLEFPIKEEAKSFLPRIVSVCSVSKDFFFEENDLSENFALKKPKRIPTVNKNFECNICGKSFLNSGHLARHSKIHRGERNHECSVCGKRVSQAYNLSTHMKIHSGQKDYKCTICGKNFIHSGHLSRHMRIHTGERNYECRLCGKMFSQSYNLSSHMAIHKGERNHECNTCGKSFIHSSNLQRHSKIHTGERNHECSVCGKSFSQSYNLATHMKFHTGERAYECKICGKKYFTSSHLSRHLKTHAGHKYSKC